MTAGPQPLDLEWDGRRFIFNELGAKEARQVARRVANIFGGALRDAAAGRDMSKVEVEAAIIAAGGAVLERLDDATIEWLTSTFQRQTMIERDAHTEDYVPLREVEALAFGGGTGLSRWYRWMRQCLELTCGDFFATAFGELKSKAVGQTAAAVPLTTAPSPSPNTYKRRGSFTES